MDVVALIGRILFVLVFLGSSFSHLTQSAGMTGYAESKKVPFPQVAVIGSGIWMLVGGLMVVLGIWGDLGALLLLIFVVAAGVLFHNFWTVTDQQAQAVEMAHFMKNLGLGGAALVLFALFASDDIGLTITGPLFG